jgi:preprotein translocase subunit SecA
VLNQQREVIYNYRDEILEGRDMSQAARQEIANMIERQVAEYTAGDFVEEWDVEGVLRRMEEMLPPDADILDVDPHRVDREELVEALKEQAQEEYDRREEEFGPELLRDIERFLLLQIIDQRWREHLYDMDYLREGIHLRGFAQIEPLVAYKNEAYELFRDLMNSVWEDYARLIFHVEVTPIDPGNGGPPTLPAPPPTRRPSRAASSSTGGGRVTYSGGGGPQGAMAIAAAAGGAGADVAELEGPAMAPVEQRRVDPGEQIGRNDPCWCGSGKKYKKCHGA